MSGIFVTGTGTEVGKTVVAAVAARSLAAAGHSVAVFKPCVTGLDEPPADGPICRDIGDKSAHRLADHELLRLAAGSTQSDAEIAPYRYGPPASPHLAAALAGEQLDPARLRDAARRAAASAEAIVCEGVGGLLVPLADGYLVRDLAVELGYPLVIAAAPGLGTINHTLLTVEAVRAARLVPQAVVMTPFPSRPGDIERSNLDTIARLGRVSVRTLAALDLDDPGSWPGL